MLLFLKEFLYFKFISTKSPKSDISLENVLHESFLPIGCANLFNEKKFLEVLRKRKSLFFGRPKTVC
jgi:hypothetical protein